MAQIEMGEKIPTFSLAATGNQTIKSSQLTGKYVVLYFYPRDNTPGCTQQAQDFRDKYEDFKEANSVILGVSRDSLASHEKFKAKFGLPFELLSDTDEKLCHCFDVIKEKNMYGKKVFGIERSTFLYNPAGKLVMMWRKVKVPGHVAEVLSTIEELS